MPMITPCQLFWSYLTNVQSIARWFADNRNPVTSNDLNDTDQEHRNRCIDPSRVDSNLKDIPTERGLQRH